MAAGERWSAFFDTTELTCKRIPSARLKASAARIELVIEERAFQRLRSFHEEYTKLQGAKLKVERFVNAQIGERPTEFNRDAYPPVILRRQVHLF